MARSGPPRDLAAVLGATVADLGDKVLRLAGHRRDAGAVFVVQLQAKHLEVLRRVVLASHPEAGPDNGSSDRRLVDDPPRRDVGHRNPVLVSDALHFSEEGLELLPVAPRADHVVVLAFRDGVEVILVKGLAHVLVRQEAPQHRAVGEDFDVVLLAVGCHERRGPLVQHAVLHLVRDHLDPRVLDRLQVLGVEVGEGEVPDLALGNHVLHVPQRLEVLPLRAVIPPVDLQEVEAFGAHFLEPLVNCRLHHLPRHVSRHRHPFGEKLRLLPELRVLLPEEGRYGLGGPVVLREVESREASFHLVFHRPHRPRLVGTVSVTSRQLPHASEHLRAVHLPPDLAKLHQGSHCGSRLSRRRLRHTRHPQHTRRGSAAQ
mmetsp:Transcript_5548/g.13470  ORF Transcript_5548/g.13470 Transcript_5548/m.13470 type:complete len:373 (+) Transcript_5548:63-1181(+)